MLKKLVSSLIGPTIALLSAAPVVHVAPLDHSLSGIQVETPSTPAFSAAFAQIVFAADRPFFDPILPYSLIVRNTGSQGIVGICVLFEITHSQGRPNRMVQTFGNIPPQVKPVIAGGQQMFVSIEGGYTHAALKPGFKISLQHSLDYYQSARAVSISVDSILYADGTFAGPDKEAMFDTYNSQLAAEESGAQAVLAYKGKDLSDLDTYLSTQAVLDRDMVNSPSPFNPFTQRLAQQGRAYKRLLARKGADALFDSAAETFRIGSSFVLTKQTQ